MMEEALNNLAKAMKDFTDNVMKIIKEKLNMENN